jgi:hypothetical protein
MAANLRDYVLTNSDGKEVYIILQCRDLFYCRILYTVHLDLLVQPHG